MDRWKTAAPKGSSQHSEMRVTQKQNIEPVYGLEIHTTGASIRVRAEEQRGSECPNKVGNK